MPSIRKRKHRRSVEIDVLTASQIRRLLTGSVYFGVCPFDNDVDLFRDAWERHCDDLLPKFIEANPGTRPFAWWLCDHGKERPIVDRGPVGDAEIARYRKKRFGFLDTNILVAEDSHFQEEETRYLERLGLLTAEEIPCPA